MGNFLSKLIFGGGIFFDLLKWAILIFVFLVIVNRFLLSVFIVDGVSMEPNLNDKSIVLYSKNFEPKRGDVVVVKYPGDPEKKRYVKRVIGLPGEELKIENNKIYIDNKVLEEDYLPFGVLTEPDGTHSLKDQYFLMGDNRESSNDSRFFGPVEKRFIAGKATLLIYPLRSMPKVEY